MGIETVALIVGAAVAAGSAGYEASESREQAREAKDAGRDQKNAALKLQKETADRGLKEQKDASLVQERARQRALVLLQGGKNPNVKTGPQGLETQPYGLKKQLGA